MTHICVRKQNIISSDCGLSPGRQQAITWTNVGILLIWPLGTNFSAVLIKIHIVLFNKLHVKMSFAKWWSYSSASVCYTRIYTSWRQSAALNILIPECHHYFVGLPFWTFKIHSNKHEEMFVEWHLLMSWSLLPFSHTPPTKSLSRSLQWRLHR